MAAAAMTLLAQSRALIIDLRQNGGGMGDMVELLAGYILDKPIEISGTYDRPTDRHTRSFTPSWVPGRRFGGTKPVFILISRRTFSAAEAFAYDMQAAGRARIVGERSGGGAHPFAYRAIDDRFVLSLPEGRSINPVTGRDWEGTGVVPDVESRADDALNVAESSLPQPDKALRQAAAAATGPPGLSRPRVDGRGTSRHRKSGPAAASGCVPPKISASKDTRLVAEPPLWRRRRYLSVHGHAVSVSRSRTRDLDPARTRSRALGRARQARRPAGPRSHRSGPPLQRVRPPGPEADVGRGFRLPQHRGRPDSGRAAARQRHHRRRRCCTTWWRTPTSAPEDIAREFGGEIAGIVDGLTKISSLTFRSSAEEQVENYRKLLLSIAKDARVIIIKLGDRLHNMRTLEHLQPERRHRIAHRDAGDLRAAGAPVRHGRHQGGAGGSRLQVPGARRLPRPGEPGGRPSGRRGSRPSSSSGRRWSTSSSAPASTGSRSPAGPSISGPSSRRCGSGTRASTRSTT